MLDWAQWSWNFLSDDSHFNKVSLSADSKLKLHGAFIVKKYNQYVFGKEDGLWLRGIWVYFCMSITYIIDHLL